ncbi:MAG: UDP-N-acetylmuramate--L-alanine ligase [Candidatus Paceibacterota bacterium]|jgi:UDP-N-acetylmuramate--alanine ligase
MDLKKYNNIHFIGIGGIGVSAIARMMILEGKKVSGSDVKESEITKELALSGATIFVGHKKENVGDGVDLVVYTVAVNSDNPEFVSAKERDIVYLSYPEVLGLISKNKKTIAVSGTHGKTTTTAMIAKIFIDAEKDPTVVVGSKLLEESASGRSNFVAGRGEYFIVEACEYRRSFLNINPTIGVITNIDNDHLDYYKDLEDIKSAFKSFVELIPREGVLVCDRGDERLMDIVNKTTSTVVDYMDFYDSEIEMLVLGEHNRKNAAVALAVANVVGIDISRAKKSLKEFKGTWRRFEYKGKSENGALIYDDYGHHPTEVVATLSGAREKFQDKKITVVFQPHLYSRTKLLLNDFANAFNDADTVLIAPIYAAREQFDGSINSEMLASKIGNKAKSFFGFTDIEGHLKSTLKDGDVLITMGAGDVFKIGDSLIK